MNVKSLIVLKMSFARRSASCWAGLVSLLALAPSATQAAGILTPVTENSQPVQLESHHVRVVINNGFARTEVEQVFYNPNGRDVEAIYAVPVPEKGALAELTIWTGEKTLEGEVVSKEDANRIYQEEKAAGNEVGKASKESYQRFDFSVYPVPADDVVRMRYAYYEPLIIDTGVGRYAYRLEEGGTDEQAASFWSVSDRVNAEVKVEVLLKSAWPIVKTRTPGFNGTITAVDDRALRYEFSSHGGQLNKDFVFCYMLESELPGRVEMVTYRESNDKPGAFMMIMTPGADLQPLSGGADYVFVLDVSGSMEGKLGVLLAGVKKAIGQLNPEDRFRIVAFNDRAWPLQRDWVSVSPEEVQRAIAEVDRLQSNGGTNVYAGVKLGLESMDADRVSTMILVTDGVANEGVVDPAAFYKLMHRQDLRFFGFLLGNSSNWPLMKLMCEASGGYYRSVSNSDDIIGEIMLAKNRVGYESLHHAELEIDGVETFDVSDFKIGKIHYGQQLVLFGRYAEGGKARVALKARLSGREEEYATEIAFPDVDTAHPELERLWALDQVQKIELNRMAGFVNAGEAKQAVRDIGIAYQIVTDETSMIALGEEGFSQRGIQRRNQERIERETAAVQAHPASSGAQRVDAQQPMYQNSSPSYGGGAVEPWVCLVAVAGGFVWFAVRRAQQRAGKSATAAALLALIAAAAAVSDLAAAEARGDLPRWTERQDAAQAPSGSIDDSIAAFWEVSAQEARVDPRAGAELGRRARENLASGRSARVMAKPLRREADQHALNQSRTKSSGGGHFGINLFNAIPIIDLVWGNRHESETDEYNGWLER